MRLASLLVPLALLAAGVFIGLQLDDLLSDASVPAPQPSPTTPHTLPAPSAPALSTSSAAREPIHTFTLSARIADRATNAPLPSALFTLLQLAPAHSDSPPVELAQTRTDEQGQVHLALATDDRDLAQLTLALALSAPGHVARVQPLTVSPTDAPRLDLGWLFLDATPTAGARVHAILRDERGTPVADALLLLGSDPLYPLADARPTGRTLYDGTLLLDGLVAPNDRHVEQHLFALATNGLAWTKLRLDTTTEVLDLPDLVLAPSTTVTVDVLDPDGRPVGGARIEARARFYPLAGLFDAREPGFAPDARVLERFTALTNGFGTATFDRLPAPFASGIYEFASNVAGIGTGAALLESTQPDAANHVVLRLELR